MILLTVHAIAVEVTKENGAKQISETTWFTNVDYRVCLNAIYAIGRSNTNVLLNLTWDANTKLLLGKIIHRNLYTRKCR